MFRLALLLLALTPLSVVAADFHDMEIWNQSDRYSRGDVVTHRNDIYVGLLPSVNKEPGGNRRWRKVKISAIRNFHTHRIYLLATAVKHREKFYLARKIAAPWSETQLDNSRVWLEFNHPAIGSGLPDDIEEDSSTLLGIDDNNNAIRDQYELTVLMKNTNDDIRYRALQAGKTYQSLLAIANSPGNIEIEEAEKIFRQLLNIRACEKLLKIQHNMDTATSYEYFNTYERIDTRYKVERLLYDILKENNLPVVTSLTPCDDLEEA